MQNEPLVDDMNELDKKKQLKSEPDMGALLGTQIITDVMENECSNEQIISNLECFLELGYDIHTKLEMPPFQTDYELSNYRGEIMNTILDEIQAMHPTILTSLIIFGERGVEIMKWLLEQKHISPMNIPGQSITPLLFALRCNAPDMYNMVRILLEHGADPNVSFGCVTPLLLSIYVSRGKETLDIVSLLMKYGADPNTTTSPNPFLVAVDMLPVQTHFEDVLMQLLQYGFEINNTLPCIPLTYAISATVVHMTKADSALCRRMYDTLKILLSVGANVNQQDQDGDTALLVLMCQACKGITYPEEKTISNIINLLVEYGADVNIVNDDQESALGWAIAHKKMLLTETLLESKADPDVVYRNKIPKCGQTSTNSPLYIIASCISPDETEEESAEHVDIAKLLIRHNADVDYVGSTGFSVLGIATMTNKVGIVDALLEGNVDVRSIGTRWDMQNEYLYSIFISKLPSDHFQPRNPIQFLCRYGKNCGHFIIKMLNLLMHTGTLSPKELELTFVNAIIGGCDHNVLQFLCFHAKGGTEFTLKQILLKLAIISGSVSTVRHVVKLLGDRIHIPDRGFMELEHLFPQVKEANLGDLGKSQSDVDTSGDPSKTFPCITTMTEEEDVTMLPKIRKKLALSEATADNENKEIRRILAGSYFTSVNPQCIAAMSHKTGNSEIMETIIKAGLSPNESCPHYNITPIGVAARYGNVTTIKTLLYLGAQVSTDALLNSIYVSQKSVVQLFVEKCKMDVKNPDIIKQALLVYWDLCTNEFRDVVLENIHADGNIWGSINKLDVVAYAINLHSKEDSEATRRASMISIIKMLLKGGACISTFRAEFQKSATFFNDRELIDINDYWHRKTVNKKRNEEASKVAKDLKLEKKKKEEQLKELIEREKEQRKVTTGTTPLGIKPKSPQREKKEQEALKKRQRRNKNKKTLQVSGISNGGSKVGETENDAHVEQTMEDAECTKVSFSPLTVHEVTQLDAIMKELEGLLAAVNDARYKKSVGKSIRKLHFDLQSGKTAFDSTIGELTDYKDALGLCGCGV